MLAMIVGSPFFDELYVQTLHYNALFRSEPRSRIVHDAAVVVIQRIAVIVVIYRCLLVKLIEPVILRLSLNNRRGTYAP